MLPPCVMMRERMIRLDGRIRGPCLHDHQHLVMARRKMVMDLHLSSSSSSSTFDLDARRTVRMRAATAHSPTFNLLQYMGSSSNILKNCVKFTP